MAVKKIPISFKVSEEDLYNFILSKRSYSGYIKDLVDADMNSKKVATIEKQVESNSKSDLGFDF